MYKTITLYIIFSIFYIMQLSAQQPTQEWVARYNSPHSINSILQTISSSFENGQIQANVNYSPFVNNFKSNYYSNTDVANGKKNSDEYNISLSFPKQSYKAYEPVIGEFCISNKSKDTLSIFYLFMVFLDYTDIVIKDESGTVYSGNKIIVDILVSSLTPTYVIMPNDSIRISMPINNWGKSHEKKYTLKDNEWYFDQFAYFPPGHTYKAHVNIKKSNLEFKGSTFQSNEAEFEVKDLDNDDIEILMLIKKGKYNEVISKYLNNPFVEHVKALVLNNYWLYMPDENMNTESLISDFEEFFEQYPNSSYLYNLRFIAPYFMKLTGRDTKKLNSEIEALKNKINCTSLYNSITSKPMVGGIKQIIENYLNFKKK